MKNRIIRVSTEVMDGLARFAKPFESRGNAVKRLLEETMMEQAAEVKQAGGEVKNA